MKTLKLSQLIEDFDLYPRDSVSSSHVSDIALAVENGAEVPPLVVDQKSKRIVDGFHRRRALIRVHGEDHELEVVEKRYKNEKELFLDACRYNAHHGLRLDTHDKTTAILKGERLGIDQSAIAEVLVMNVDKAASLRAGRTAKENGNLVPIKNTIKHMAGERLTKRQLAANKKLSGMNQSFYVNQLIELIESNMLDTSDEMLMKRVAALHELLQGLAVK